jgi:6-phosphogluconolactonase
MIAGTYSREGGPGLIPFTAGKDGWTAGSPFSDIRNASFGVEDRGRHLHYLLEEQGKGMLGIYDGGFRRLGRHSTGGADPCHAALSPDQSLLAVANYSSGNVAVWNLDPKTGLPRGEAQLVQHEGRGPDGARQAGPHAHWVGFTDRGRALHSVDLGADAIFAHRVASQGTIGDTSIAYRAVPGSGPRHLARHPRLPVAYLVAELANTVTVLHARPDASFTATGMASTLPRGFGGSSAAAHIAINDTGTRLYVSNRGHDSIAVFAIGRDGALEPIQHIGCGGHWPRFFLLVPQRKELLVANERSGDIVSFQVEEDGRLRAGNRRVAAPGVVFLSA